MTGHLGKSDVAALAATFQRQIMERGHKAQEAMGRGDKTGALAYARSAVMAQHNLEAIHDHA